MGQIGMRPRPAGTPDFRGLDSRGRFPTMVFAYLATPSFAVTTACLPHHGKEARVAHPTPRSAARQAQRHLDRAQRTAGLPFAHLLDPAQVQAALDAERVAWRERWYSPLVTLYVFLGQLFDPDPSCRQAVARYLAYRLSSGQGACSADPSAYGKARGRLPEAVLQRLARGSAARAPERPEWRWCGR